MSVNIQIAGHNPLRCPVNRTAKETTNHIRDSRLLSGGEIERNGVVMFPNDIISPEGDYHFVNFREQAQPPSAGTYCLIPSDV